MQPAATTATGPFSSSSSSSSFSIESTMAPSLSIQPPSSSPIIAGAIDPLLDATLVKDAITPLASGPCADAGNWFCCVCNEGPFLEPHNVGCGNCGHVKCAGCSTKK